MSCQKRKADEERGRGESNPAKRPCLPHERLVNQAAPQNTNKYTDEERKQILAVLQAEFDKELQAKENEVVEVQERIQKTLRILQYLCYAVVSDFYSREKTISSVASTRQRRIHPAVKKLLSGKGPPGAPEVPQILTVSAEQHGLASSSHRSQDIDVIDTDVLSRIESPSTIENLSGKDKKIPRYIPPKAKPKRIVESEPVRGGQNKVKTILVVGNLSKWLPPDMRDDSASHKWMVYVRGPKGNPDISSFVSKVRFFLHPSYRPNDVVQVVCPPFHLSRRGWGEFPIRVQVHFSNSLNKPVDIIHNLKLDRTHCGMQTLGSETVAEVWIHREPPPSNSSSETILIEEPPLLNEESLDDLDEDSTILTDKSITQDSPSTNLHFQASSVSTIGKSSIATLKSGKSCEPVMASEDDQSSSKENSGHSAPYSPLPLDVKPFKIKAEPIEVDPCISASPITSSICKIGTDQEVTVSSSDTKIAAIEASLPTQQSLLNPPASNVSLVSRSPQKIPTSPLKPAMQLVKCVDSNGTVRLLQVRADMLPKILKRSTTAMPPTPQISQAVESKATVDVSNLQTSAPQVVCQKTMTQVAAHASLTQASLIHAKSPSSVIHQTPEINKKSQNCSVQVLPQNPTLHTPSKVNVKEPPANVSVQVPAATVNLYGPSLMPCKGSPTKLVPNSPLKVQGVQAGIALPHGVRPMLRLVRPAGNPNARPTLIANNPASQQVIRLPASVANNANRPLLVLKDGKLFMMKSALGSASVKVSTPSRPVDSTNVNLPEHPSAENVSSGEFGVSSASLKSIAAQSASSVFIAPSLIAAEAKSKPDLAQPANVKSNVNMFGQQTLSLPGPTLEAVIKSRTSTPVSSAITLLSSKPSVGESPKMHPSIKSTLVSGQSMNPPQSVFLPASTAKIAVKAGKSLLKPAISLLKTNAAASISTIKPVSSPVSVSGNQSLLRLLPTPSASTTIVSGEAVTVNKRIILGRTSGPSCITTTSQQALLFREVLRSIVRACPRGMLEDIWRAVRWMVKNLPLINSNARHLEFKILHPYCAPDEKTFCSWNIGKQRACEWLRAKTARVLLIEAGWNLKNVWTVREIVLWARLHGYTPGLYVMRNPESKSPICGRPSASPNGDCENPISSICKSGKMSTVQQWLEEGGKSSPLSSLCYIQGVPTEEPDEEVDIISSVSTSCKGEIKQEPAACEKDDNADENMHLDPISQPLGTMVIETLNSVGLRLSPEEVLPGVRYPAAHRVLIQAVQSLVEDLARRAYAEAWGKDNISRRPDYVDVSHVCSAICHRPEFDIFTCAGLGVNSVSDS